MAPLSPWSKLPFCCGNLPLLPPLPLCTEPSRPLFPRLPNPLQEAGPPTPKPGGRTGLRITNSISSSLPEVQGFDGCSSVLEACFCAQLLASSTGGVHWKVVASFRPAFRVVEIGGCFCDGRLSALPSSDEVSDEEDEGGRCFVSFCFWLGADEGVLEADFLGASSSSLLLLLESEEEACWAAGDFFFWTGWSTLTGVFLVDATDLSFFSVFFFFFFSLHFPCNFFFFSSTDVCFTSVFFFFKSTLISISSVWCSSVGLCLFLGFLFVFSLHLTLSPLNRSRYSTLTLKFLKRKWQLLLQNRVGPLLGLK